MESVTVAYALAAKSNRLVDWEVVLGDRQVEFAERVGKAAKEVNHEAYEAFVVAGNVFEQWIRMKEEPRNTESRQGPASL